MTSRAATYTATVAPHAKGRAQVLSPMYGVVYIKGPGFNTQLGSDFFRSFFTLSYSSSIFDDLHMHSLKTVHLVQSVMPSSHKRPTQSGGG